MGYQKPDYFRPTYGGLFKRTQSVPEQPSRIQVVSALGHFGLILGLVDSAL